MFGSFSNGMDLIARGAIETLKYRGNYEKAYPYELAADRDLVEYGIGGSKRRSLEDYFDITYQHGVPYRMTNAVATTRATRSTRKCSARS